MSATIGLPKSLMVQVSVADLAWAFCQFDDDAQAQFFVEVSRLMNEWGGLRRAKQLRDIGNHLDSCDCSTEDARQLVRAIAEELEP